jgi:hypothetical protein
MKRLRWLASFVMLSVAVASEQRSVDRPSPIKPADVSCQAVYLYNGPYQCPNDSGCGVYVTFSGEDCNIDVDNDETCMVLVRTPYRCGKYNIPIPTEQCLFTEIKSPGIRSRRLELAEENDILVPTCSGAYVPARIALRKQKGKDNGGL